MTSDSVEHSIDVEAELDKKFGFSKDSSDSSIDVHSKSSISDSVSDNSVSSSVSSPKLSSSSFHESSDNSLFVSPSLIKAYAANLTKILFLFATVVGAYFIASGFVGQEYIVSMLKQVGVSLSLVKNISIGIASVILVLTIFDTTSLSSIGLSLRGRNFTFSHGNFFKSTQTFHLSSIIRVNYREYWPLKTGVLTLELSGTTLKKIEVPYASRVREVCRHIDRLTKRNQDEDSDGI